MTEEEIIIGNRLIADFMGGDSTKSPCYLPDRLLYYNSSWDWLMPVVIKMASTPEYYVWCSEKYGDFGKFYMEGNPIGAFGIIPTQPCDVLLTMEILWKECVKFIEWHNKEI